MKRIIILIAVCFLFFGVTYSKPYRQDDPSYQTDHNRTRNFTPTQHYLQEEIDNVSDIFNGINYHEFIINEDLGDVTSKLIFGRTTGGNGEISWGGSYIGINKPTHFTISDDGISIESSGEDAIFENIIGSFVGFRSPNSTYKGFFFNENTDGDGAQFRYYFDGTSTNSRFEWRGNVSEWMRLQSGSLLINATELIGSEKLRVNGNQYNDGTVSLDALILREKSSDPADPAEGQSVIWQSDGTGAGDDGDIIMKITAGGSTKTITIVDFSTY